MSQVQTAADSWKYYGLPRARQARRTVARGNWTALRIAVVDRRSRWPRCVGANYLWTSQRFIGSEFVTPHRRATNRPALRR